jgi:hypothetical protein
MISRALFAGAATALALTVPVFGAGVVNVTSDQVPACKPAAYDLDMSLAVLTPNDMCVDLDQAAYEVAPAPSVAPDTTSDSNLVADTAATDDVVVPVARIARPVEVVPVAEIAPVRTTPARTVPAALTASLPKPVAVVQPAFSNDRLWMIGVYR